MKRNLLLSLLMISLAQAAPPTTAPVPLLSPEEEVKTFQIDPGLKVEVVASEPLVEHPVAIAWDAKGRLWVAEMRGYMPNLSGTGELKPIGRVSMLEDTDGDGRMDKSTIFLDNLVLPRAIGFAGDGVLIGTPPNLLFCRDTNNDGKCDQQTLIATDFGVPENPENGANGLVYGLDNWIYSADWNKRLRYTGDNHFDIQPVPVMGQWGMTRDDFDHWYFNTNSDYLRGSAVPPAYGARNPRTPTPLTDARVATDEEVFPSHPTTENRGYREGFLHPDGSLKEFTAACGPCIYRGQLLPSFYGNAFICEPTANLIRRATLSIKDGLLSGKNATPGREFLTSTYERFRPVNCATAPDGALVIVDMHHGLIQHKMSLTDYARAEYQAKTLDKHLLTGRIFRIVPADAAKPVIPNLASESTAQLVTELTTSNGWRRDTAQRLLVEQKDPAAIPLLKTMATTDTVPLHRVQALWTLDGLGAINADFLQIPLKDPDPNVRITALRLGQNHPEDLMALENDPDPAVRLQFILSLGTTPTRPLDAAILRVVLKDPRPANLQAMLTGLNGVELKLLTRLSTSPDWQTASALKSDILKEIAQSLVHRDVPADVAALLDFTGTQVKQSWQQSALLSAMPAVREDDFGLTKLIEVPAEPAGLQSLTTSPDDSIRKRAISLSSLFHWPGKVMPPRPKPRDLTPAEKSLMAIGEVQFTKVCAQCHQPDGRGQAGKAPPLAGSPWVIGPDKRLARIVLHGMRGPVTVEDKPFNLEMPSFKILTDEQIAGILTYIRRSWGHEAPPVEVETIRTIRDWGQARRDGWTEPELLKIK